MNLFTAVFWKFGSKVCYLGGAILLVFPLIKVNNLRKRLFIINDKKLTPVTGDNKLD